jgi:hypothetical protein
MQAKLGTSLLLLVLAGIAAQAQESGSDADDVQAARATGIDALEPALSAADLSAASAAIDAEPAVAEASDPTTTKTLIAQEIRRGYSSNGVMDEMDLGRTEITGNQELPKVLYIVPWQKSDPGDLTGKPINTLLDEVLAPIDRSEFIRQVEYYDDLYRGAEQ